MTHKLTLFNKRKGIELHAHMSVKRTETKETEKNGKKVKMPTVDVLWTENVI